jgi:hypothetical protein
MLFVDLVTEQPKTKVQLENENKNTSLPSSWTDETLATLGVARVTSTPAPEVGEYQVAIKDGVEKVNEVWAEKWSVKPMFAEYTDDTRGTVSVEMQIAEYEADKLAKAREDMVVSMRQCRLALLADGTLANVDVAIASLPEPDKSAAQVEWEYAATVQRTSPFVASLGAAIGYDDAKMDALFEAAADL